MVFAETKNYRVFKTGQDWEKLSRLSLCEHTESTKGAWYSLGNVYHFKLESVLSLHFIFAFSSYKAVQ